MSSTNGMGPLPDDDIDSGSDLGHGDARHGQADLSGDPVPAQSRRRRRRHRQRLRLPRQAGPGAQGQARLRRHHHRPDLVRRIVPTCSRPTTATRRPSHRFTRWTPACVDSPKRRIASAAERERRSPGWARSPAAAVWTCGSRVDNDGELYILTKSDGMIRKVVGARPRRATSTATVPLRAARTSQPASHQPQKSRRSTPGRSPPGSGPTTPTAPPVTATWRKGRSRPASTISIIEEQRGKQPPDLTDDQWDHGSSDGEIFARHQARVAADA